MYGVEAQGTGLGGLAAQAPAMDLYFASVVGQANAGVSPQIGGAGVTSGLNAVLPYTNVGDQTPQGLTGSPAGGEGPVSGNGSAVRVPVSQQMQHWSSVLDFHNSTAPWILLGILVLYGWIHLSVQANAGKRVSASAVL
jgi:hypothetical protein